MNQFNENVRDETKIKEEGFSYKRQKLFCYNNFLEVILIAYKLSIVFDQTKCK